MHYLVDTAATQVVVAREQIRVDKAEKTVVVETVVKRVVVVSVRIPVGKVGVKGAIAAKEARLETEVVVEEMWVEVSVPCLV